MYRCVSYYSIPGNVMSQVASKSLNESVREMLTFREATHLKIK